MLRSALRVVAVLSLVAVPAARGATPSAIWLCRPGLAINPCETSRAATDVSSTGVRTALPTPKADRRVDCFYVYPTVSRQMTVNATRVADATLRGVAVQQASRFSQHCRVFAPVYRQLPVSALFASRSAAETRRAVERAYADVRAAWREYLRRDNHGRGVVLLGHSQGSGHLTRLIREEIDPKPAVREKLVSALLLGGQVTVAPGSDRGADFRHVPACRRADQTGCVVAYSSFLKTPPNPSLFGRSATSVGFFTLFGGVSGPGTRVLCTNPAGLLHRITNTPYFRTGSGWETYPGLYAARCAHTATANWLQVTPTPFPADVRPVVKEQLGRIWGLHLIDVNIALGDLVDLVGRQSRAYLLRD